MIVQSTFEPATPVKDEKGAPLVCYGCGHSAAMVPYPGRPSGERPCLFCIRNPEQFMREEALQSIRDRLKPGQKYTARYDNGPTRGDIGDQYISTYRITRDLEEGVVAFG